MRAFSPLTPPLLALLAFGGACMPSFAPIDTGKPLTDKDLALAFSRPANSDADDFSEQLVVRARMEDEASIYVKLTVTNLASADGRADLTVNVTLADGRKLRFKERRDRGEWELGRDRFHAEIGAGTVEVGVGRTHVVVKSEEFELDFEVTSTLPPLRPRGGLYDKGGRYYVTTIPIPRGNARARLKVLTAGEEGPPGDEPAPEEESERLPSEDDAPAAPPGDLMAAPELALAPAASLPRELELDGVGYAEHRAGNVAPYALARRWYSILDIGDDMTVMLSAFEQAPPEGTPRNPQAPPGPMQGFFFAASDDAMQLFEPEIELRVRGWQIDDKTTYPLPQLLFFSGREGSSFEGVVVPGPLSERKDDLQGLSRLERIIVRKFMKPWTFRFDRARYLFRRQRPGEAMREIRGSDRLQVQQLN